MSVLELLEVDEGKSVIVDNGNDTIRFIDSNNYPFLETVEISFERWEKIKKFIDNKIK